MSGADGSCSSHGCVTDAAGDVWPVAAVCCVVLLCGSPMQLRWCARARAQKHQLLPCDAAVAAAAAAADDDEDQVPAATGRAP
jgi:hypothetical protein